MNLFTENLKNRFMLKQCIKLKFREIMPLSFSLSLFGITDCFFPSDKSTNHGIVMLHYLDFDNRAVFHSIVETKSSL